MDRRQYFLGVIAVVVCGLCWAYASLALGVPSTVATLVGMLVGGVLFLVGFDIGTRRWWEP